MQCFESVGNYFDDPPAQRGCLRRLAGAIGGDRSLHQDRGFFPELLSQPFILERARTDIAGQVSSSGRVPPGGLSRVVMIRGACARREAAGPYFPQTSFAISTASLSFAHCSSSERMLPSSVEAKPHCGEIASCSSGANFEASSSRRMMSSFFSSSPNFEVMTPTTTTLLPLGRKRSGSKPPARSESYSRK